MTARRIGRKTRESARRAGWARALPNTGHPPSTEEVTHEDLLLLLGYVAAGVGFGMRISLLAAIPADLLAGRHLGVILGAAQGGGGHGGFIGPFLGGWLFDVTGSYQIAFGP